MAHIDPRPGELGALKTWLVVRYALDDCAGEEDLREFGAGIEGVRAQVAVYLIDRGEGGVGEGTAVEFRGLEDESGVRGGLEVRE